MGGESTRALRPVGPTRLRPPRRRRRSPGTPRTRNAAASLPTVARCVFERSNAAPRAISKAPVMYTSASRAGIQSGRCWTNGSDLAKWPTPAMTMATAKPLREWSRHPPLRRRRARQGRSRRSRLRGTAWWIPFGSACVWWALGSSHGKQHERHRGEPASHRRVNGNRSPARHGSARANWLRAD